MTKTYYDEFMKTEFDATVLNCIQDGDSYLVELDESCFYAEGGGQPSDKGTINGLEVSEVLWREESLLHRVSEPLSGTVHGSVNYAWREEMAQVHSAMHLIGGEINRIFKAPTLSIHAGEDVNELIYDTNEFSDEQFAWLQNHINDLVKQDLPITISYPTKEEALKYTSDESKIDHENLRLVCISDRDYNFCGCVHVEHLLQIQMIQLISYTISKGHLYIYFSCGTQLQRYLQRRIAVLDEASSLVGYSHLEVPQGIKDKLNAIKEKDSVINRLKEQLMNDLVSRLSQNELIVEEFDNFEVKEVQMLSGMLTKNETTCVGLVAHMGERAHVLLAQGKGSDKDLRGLFKELSTKFDLRGGGNPFCVQGGCTYSVELLEEVRKVLSK